MIDLRDVTDEDVGIFYEHQLDPEACAMAAFPSRHREAHFAHWDKIRKQEGNLMKTIVVDDQVAGNVVSWVGDDGKREIGYWIGKEYWGRGIATAALHEFVALVEERPLYAWVAHHNAGSVRVLERSGFVNVADSETHLIYELR